MIEQQEQIHDSDAERDSCWCDRCGFHHSGDCPPDIGEDFGEREEDHD